MTKTNKSRQKRQRNSDRGVSKGGGTRMSKIFEESVRRQRAEETEEERRQRIANYWQEEVK